MAFVISNAGRAYLNAVDVSGYLRGFTIAGSQDVAESTVLTDAAKTYVPGQSARTHSMEGLYHKDLAAVRASLEASEAVVTLAPGGAAIGDLAWLSSVVGAAYEESTPVADVVPFAWEGTPTGPVAFGFLLHPLAEDTNTTTGASRDDAAATTTGWVAHLHVTAVDAGSWVVKLQDSADNGTWADVSGGAMASLSAPGSQRLASAAGATLRRYVRYVATRTGGSAGDGITFALALSRAHIP